MRFMKHNERVKLADYPGLHVRVGPRGLDLIARGGERGLLGMRELIEDLQRLEEEMKQDAGDGLVEFPVEWPQEKQESKPEPAAAENFVDW